MALGRLRCLASLCGRRPFVHVLALHMSADWLLCSISYHPFLLHVVAISLCSFLSISAKIRSSRHSCTLRNHLLHENILLKYSGFSIIRIPLCQCNLNTSQISDLVRISERPVTLIVLHNGGHHR